MHKSIKNLVIGVAVVGAFALVGCLNDSHHSSSQDDATLAITMGVKDIKNLGKKGLSKGSAITLSKMVVTLTSSVGADAVIRDTIIASDTVGSSFKSASDSAQTLGKVYNIKPLRNYTIQVKTLDSKDSVIHIASATANSIKIGETRAVVLNLTSKYVVYVAKFTLPDSIGSSSSTDKQKLYVRRFKMTVDGITVRDSSLSYFTPATAHNLIYDYVRSDTAHSIGLFVYADSLGDWNPNLPIFADTIVITSNDTTYSPVLPWTGPGSPSDPDYDPSNPSPGGAKAGLTINIGAVGTVVIDNSTCTFCLPKSSKK